MPTPVGENPAKTRPPKARRVHFFRWFCDCRLLSGNFKSSTIISLRWTALPSLVAGYTSFSENSRIALSVIADDRVELFRRVGDHQRALLLHALAYIRDIDGLCDVLADLGEDRAAYPCRRQDPEPGFVFVVWQTGFRDCRHVRQLWSARW